jgi:hypothetical protein
MLPPSRAPHRGFVIGANLPWVSYGGDFGANLWHPRGGLAARHDLERLGAVLARLRDRGVIVIRWFVLCDGRAGVRFAENGTPLGLDDAVHADFDVALDLARRAGVLLIPVLLDFHWCLGRRIVHGVQLGGRRASLVDPIAREALLDRVLGPLLRRYGAEPIVWAWDVMNEPEWVTLGLGSWNPFSAVEQADMKTFLELAVSMVHAEAKQPVTVGSASAAWLPLVQGIGLDLYQPHWYDRLERLSALSSPVRTLGLDRPAILGEFPTRGSSRDVKMLLTAARESGYSGALLWSVLSSDVASDYESADLQLADWWREQPPDAGNGRTAATG